MFGVLGEVTAYPGDELLEDEVTLLPLVLFPPSSGLDRPPLLGIGREREADGDGVGRLWAAWRDLYV